MAQKAGEVEAQALTVLCTALVATGLYGPVMNFLKEREPERKGPVTAEAVTMICSMLSSIRERRVRRKASKIKNRP